MKKILFLLLITVAGYGQTLQNPTFGNTTTNTLKIKTPATVTSVNFLPTLELDGGLAKIDVSLLPVSTATFNAINTATAIKADTTDVNIQTVVNNTPHTGIVDGGNTQVSMFEGSENNRSFGVTVSNGSSASGTLSITNTVATLSNGILGIDDGLVGVQNGKVIIAQTNPGVGTTNISVEDPIAATNWKTPAKPYGNYIYASTEDVDGVSSNAILKNSDPQTKTGGFTSGGVNMTYTSDNWIAIGTSVTFGNTYTGPMSAQLGLILTNLGVAGSTSNDIVNHYSEIPTLNSGNENSYRLISIEHGINDAAQSIPLATFRTNLENAIAHIKGKNWADNKILIINGNYCSSVLLTPVQEAYANEAILIAKEQGIQYSDTYNYTKNNGGSTLLSDGIHPTSQGGLVYARGVIASMQGGGEFSNALTVINGITVGNLKVAGNSSFIGNISSAGSISGTTGTFSGAISTSSIMSSTGNNPQLNLGATAKAGRITFSRGSDGVPNGSIGYPTNSDSSEIRISAGGGGAFLTFHTAGSERARFSGTGDFLLANATANTIASFDATKNLKSLPLATYPSLTELSYGKGVTSSIQTQIDAKLSASLILSESATLDFPSTAAGTSSELTITVTGASDSDVVSLGIPNVASNPNSCFTSRVSAANTISVKFNNYSSASTDPASGTFKVKVFK